MIASLAMYPFAQLREAYDVLWSAVRARLGDAPERLDRDTVVYAAWTRHDLLVGQACGWPLITDLAQRVTVIGAFDVVAPFAEGGCYRSVLVANKPLGVREWKARPGTVVAQNDPGSLSGWISLQHSWGGVPEHVLHTGAHLLSMRAVAGGQADVACIDALSFEFIVDAEPAMAARVHVIGHGPLVPSTPLIMANELAHRRDEVRDAFAAAVADAANADALARLRISGFVPFGFADYESLRGLLPSR